MNDEKWNTMLQQFVTYVTKNFVKKVKILLKSNIIAIITQENIEYWGLAHLICNLKCKEHGYAMKLDHNLSRY